MAAAQREFLEETGFSSQGPFFELGTVRQASGKLVTGWAFEGDCDPAQLVSNTCMIEWPPKSKRQMEIPEIDQGRWFTVKEAAEHMRPEQVPLLDSLVKHLD